MTSDEARAMVDRMNKDMHDLYHTWNEYCIFKCHWGVIYNHGGWWPCVCNIGYPGYMYKEAKDAEKHFKQKEQKHLSDD